MGLPCSKSIKPPSARRRAGAPATYIGFWDTERKLFANTLQAKARLPVGRFSFNTGEGRCPACEGQGVRTIIAMSFLPDVKVPCEACHGNMPLKNANDEVIWPKKTVAEICANTK